MVTGNSTAATRLSIVSGGGGGGVTDDWEESCLISEEL